MMKILFKKNYNTFFSVLKLKNNKTNYFYFYFKNFFSVDYFFVCTFKYLNLQHLNNAKLFFKSKGFFFRKISTTKLSFFCNIYYPFFSTLNLLATDYIFFCLPNYVETDISVFLNIIAENKNPLVKDLKVLSLVYKGRLYSTFFYNKFSNFLYLFKSSTKFYLFQFWFFCIKFFRNLIIYVFLNNLAIRSSNLNEKNEVYFHEVKLVSMTDLLIYYKIV